MSRTYDATTNDKKTNAVVRGGVWSLVVAFVATLVAAFGICSTIFLWRHPEIWNDAENEPTTFRVRSRSMEPTFRGPRQCWLCPNCGAFFDVSIDDEEEKSARSEFDPTRALFESPSARRALDSARFFACPRCGFNQASPVAGKEGLVDGDLARAAVDSQDASTKENVFDKIKRAMREELRRTRRRASERVPYKPRRWDVVVFRDKLGRPILKRVVGLEGERVGTVNGDVFVDGKIAHRSLKQILATRVPLDSVEFRSESRAGVARQVALFENGQTIRKSVPISNESPFPNRGGRNVAPVELARDFLLSFSWFVGDGSPLRFGALARRPTQAFLLEYDEGAQRVALRSLPLIQGKTDDGRAFEELDRADFVNSHASFVSLDASESSSPSSGRAFVLLALVDGELIVTIDGRERARFSTNDVNSTLQVGVSAPFVVLGDVERLSDLRLYRDLHYSNVDELRTIRDVAQDERVATLVGEETLVPQGRLFLLGDNSPASLDSRFQSFGTVDVGAVLYQIVPQIRSVEALDDVKIEADKKRPSTP